MKTGKPTKSDQRLIMCLSTVNVPHISVMFTPWGISNAGKSHSACGKSGSSPSPWEQLGSHRPAGLQRDRRSYFPWINHWVSKYLQNWFLAGVVAEFGHAPVERQIKAVRGLARHNTLSLNELLFFFNNADIR